MDQFESFGIPTRLKDAFLDALDAAFKEEDERMQYAVATIVTFGTKATVAAMMSWLLPVKSEMNRGTELEHHIVLMNDDGPVFVDGEDSAVPYPVRRAISLVQASRGNLQDAVVDAYNDCLENGGVTTLAEMMMAMLNICGQVMRSLVPDGVPVDCPYCRKKFKAVGMNGEGKPSPGDAVLCTMCENVSMFTEDLGLRKPTAEELKATQSEEDFKTAIIALREYKKRNVDFRLN